MKASFQAVTAYHTPPPRQSIARADCNCTANSAEYLEARIRFLDEPDTVPRHIIELLRDHIRRDISLKGNRLTLTDRPTSVPEPK